MKTKIIFCPTTAVEITAKVSKNVIYCGDESRDVKIVFYRQDIATAMCDHVNGRKQPRGDLILSI